MKSRIRLCASIFSIAAAVAAAPSQAQEQTPAETETSGLSDIVVTARKVEERLQDVPVAVTAFNENQLTNLGIDNVSDLSGITPGLVVNFGEAGVNVARFSLRGQYQRSNLASTDPSVGIYVDGVYWARAFGIVADTPDLASIQVLKGPQGTLFGRNTTGGAILINTNDPNFDGFSGSVKASYGRFGTVSGTLVANVPVVEDKVAIRATVQATQGNGYIKDPANPSYDYGGPNTVSARFKMLFQLGERTDLLLSADIFEDDPLASQGQLRYVTTTSASNRQAGAEILGNAACSADLAACSATGRTYLLSLIDKTLSRPDEASYNFRPFAEASTRTYLARLRQELPFGQAQILGGYRKIKTDAHSDYDGSPVDIVSYGIFQNLKQWSIEGQVTGEAFNDALQFATGIFYFEESGSDMSRFSTYPSFNPRGSKFDGYIDNKSIGIYGQGTLKVTDQLSLTGGLRWSQDDKAVTIANGSYIGTGLNEVPGSFICSVAAGCPTKLRGKFDGISYTAGLDYKITPDIMVYAKVASAFRSGGVNMRQTTIVPGTREEPFLPEQATSYEVGLKSEVMDRRVRLNLAGWYMPVKDLQREFLISDGITTATIAANAGKAEFYGGEAELTVLAIDNGDTQLTLGANGSLTKAKYIDYTDPQSGFDRSGERFQNVPEWEFNLSATLEQETGAGKLLLFGSYTWDNGYALDGFNYYIDPNGVARLSSNGSVIPLVDAQNLLDVLTKKKGGVLDVRAAFKFGEGERFELAAFGRNILNNRQFMISNATTAIAITQWRRPPATYGLELTARF